LLDFYDLGNDFEIQRSIRTLAHQNLIHQNDVPSAQYADVIRSIYAALRDQLIELNVKAVGTIWDRATNVE